MKIIGRKVDLGTKNSKKPSYHNFCQGRFQTDLGERWMDEK